MIEQFKPSSLHSGVTTQADTSCAGQGSDRTGDSESSSSSAPADAEPPEPSSPTEPDPTSAIPDIPQIQPNSDLTVTIIVGMAELPASLVVDELTKFLRKSISAVAAHLGIQSGIITANLIDDEEMTELHDHFCGLRSTTDVLTFDLATSESEWAAGHPISTSAGNSEFNHRVNLLRRTHLEVDLALCVDEALRQAKQRQHHHSEELLLYAIHGILHCLGHDDHDPAGFEMMHELEDEILEIIGVAPVFRTNSENGDV